MLLPGFAAGYKERCEQNRSTKIQYFELTETSECSRHWRELAERLLWEKEKLFRLILSLPNQWWNRPKKEMVIFWNCPFSCTVSLPGLPVGCYAVEDILEECWAGTPEALQPSSAKQCRSRASCCRSQGGRWPCPTLSRRGRQARSRYIDGGRQVVTSGCLYLKPWQTENRSSLQAK